MGFANVYTPSVCVHNIVDVVPVPTVQRQRTAGWRMPQNAVYVGRPSKWGNPYSVKQAEDFSWFVVGRGNVYRAGDEGVCWSKTQALSFAVYLFCAHMSLALVRQAQQELVGKTLVCWCRQDGVCHAQPLAWVAAGLPVEHWVSPVGVFNTPLCEY